MPDLTLLGEYWEFLLKGNYPKDVFQPDKSAPTLSGLLQSEKLKLNGRNYHLPRSLSATPNWGIRRLSMCFRQSNFPWFNLTVKLHPREFSDAGYYEAIAKEAGCTNYVSTKLRFVSTDCSQRWLPVSQLFIETIYFYNPDILDHLKQDIWDMPLRRGISGVWCCKFNKHFRNLPLQLKIDRAKYDSFIHKYASGLTEKWLKGCRRVTCKVASGISGAGRAGFLFRAASQTNSRKAFPPFFF